MKTHRFLLSILFLLSLASARAVADEPARVAGVWQWQPKDQTVTINADGTCASSYNVTGLWTQIDAETRTYKIQWKNGFVDVLTLSKDGNTLTGSNQHAAHSEPFTRIK